MLLIGITIIEHEDMFCGGAISTTKPDLAMFQYKQNVKQLLIKMIALQSRSLSFKLNDIFYYSYFCVLIL